MMDDVLIYGCDQAQHDERLRLTLDRLMSAGVTLNKEKSCFGVTEIKFSWLCSKSRRNQAGP